MNIFIELPSLIFIPVSSLIKSKAVVLQMCGRQTWPAVLTPFTPHLHTERHYQPILRNGNWANLILDRPHPSIIMWQQADSRKKKHTHTFYDFQCDVTEKWMWSGLISSWGNIIFFHWWTAPLKSKVPQLWQAANAHRSFVRSGIGCGRITVPQLFISESRSYPLPQARYLIPFSTSGQSDIGFLY